MSNLMVNVYRTIIEHRAKFVEREYLEADLAGYDFTLNWLFKRYLWVSTQS